MAGSKSLWCGGSLFTLMQMHPECPCCTVCPGWWKLRQLFNIWHLDGVFQDIRGGRSLVAYCHKNLCALWAGLLSR